MDTKKYTFHVKGMHCNSCVLLTESELKNHPKVLTVKSSLSTSSVEISGDFGEMSRDDMIRELSGFLSQHSLLAETKKEQVAWKDFMIALPVAFAFLTVFFFLQKMGIVNLIQTDNVTFGTAFVVGLIASISSCMAVVGGLLLSLSATVAKEKNSSHLQVGFHAGRIVSFFILGGVIGLLGTVFQFGQVGMLILGIAIGIIMFVLGINLLNIFHWSKRVQLSMPKSISKKVFNFSRSGSVYAATALGAATFFLPCGFTQSMQFYTLSAGDFFTGGLIMLFFALGTLPMLALVSFGSSEIHKSPYAGIFLKTAGLIVIFFALFNIINSMVAIGWIPPVFNF